MIWLPGNWMILLLLMHLHNIKNHMILCKEALKLILNDKRMPILLLTLWKN